MASKDYGKQLDWLAFSVIANENMKTFLGEDTDLKQLLSQENPPLERTDAVGRPLPMSSVIARHPDVTNFRRVLEIRAKRAGQDGDVKYQAYADEVLRFLASLDLSKNLFVVLLASNSYVYECLFFPESKAFYCSKV